MLLPAKTNQNEDKMIVMGPALAANENQTGPQLLTYDHKKKIGSVFVQGPFMNRAIVKMFERRGYKEALHPQEADFVVWTGGADINPSIYKEKVMPGTYYTNALDIRDVQVYNVSTKAFKIGICRGAQLLCALNGGKLWQDVDKHNDGGIHDVKDVQTGEVIGVNTLHHQQMILPKEGAELVAYCRTSTKKESYERVWDMATNMNDLEEVDVEAAWFPKTMCLCYQPHPEFSHPATTRYFFDLIERYAFPENPF